MLGICEIGQRVSNGFDKIGGEIEVFNWHLFSHQRQKILMIVLMRAQTPIELNYFGSISAARENAKKVSLDF